jgi:MFS family permease
MSDCTLPVHAPSPRPTGPSLTWVVTAYTLSFGGLMLLGGRLADTFGRAIIWIDSHPDIGTPASHYPGFHAMAVAALTGHGDPGRPGAAPGHRRR